MKMNFSPYFLHLQSVHGEITCKESQYNAANSLLVLGKSMLGGPKILTEVDKIVITTSFRLEKKTITIN